MENILSFPKSNRISPVFVPKTARINAHRIIALVDRMIRDMRDLYPATQTSPRDLPSRLHLLRSQASQIAADPQATLLVDGNLLLLLERNAARHPIAAETLQP